VLLKQEVKVWQSKTNLVLGPGLIKKKEERKKKGTGFDKKYITSFLGGLGILPKNSIAAAP